MKKGCVIWVCVFWVLVASVGLGAQRGGMSLSEKEIIERLTRLEEGQKALFELLSVINKRIDDTNKRIDDVNKRINEVKEELNKRIDDTNKRIDEMKEELNKRIDDTNKRIDKLIDILIGITAVFGGLVVAMMGLVFWDRKTLIEKASERALEKVEGESRVVLVLRELAKTDKQLAEVMRSFGLL